MKGGKEKRKRKKRRGRRRNQAKVWNLDFCIELTLDMNSSMDHIDFVWLITCLQI